MSHVRQQIREAAATVLTGLATTGTRVYQTRVRNIAQDKLPCLIVETNGEEAQALDLHGNPTLQRDMALIVRVHARSNANLDDVLDTIQGEAETALANAFITNSLSGLVRKLVYAGADPEFDVNGEIVAGVQTLRFDVTYFTQANAPETAN